MTLSEAGTVKVTFGLVTKKRGKKSRTVALAKARVRFAGSGAKTIKLKLGRKARLRLARVTKARIRLSASATDLAGNRATRTLARTLRR